MLLLNNIGLILAAQSNCWDAEPPAPCDDSLSIAWLLVIPALALAYYYYDRLQQCQAEVERLKKQKQALPDIRTPIEAILNRHKKEAENWGQAQAKAALDRAQADIGNELTKQGFPPPPPPPAK